MNSNNTLISAHKKELALAAADVVYVDDIEEALEGVIAQLAEACSEKKTLDLSDLYQRGCNEFQISRMLRVIESGVIELLRKHLNHAEFSEQVSRIRHCVHHSLPRHPVSQDEVQFYKEIMMKKPEEASGEQRQLLELFQSVTAACSEIVYVHDLHGVLLYINDAGLEKTKYSQEDFVEGLTIQDVVVPEYLDFIEARLESPGAVSRSPYCSEIYTKDGERIPIEISSRVLLRDNQIYAVVGTARDLRLARRLEAEMRRVNMALDNIFSNSPMGIIRISHQCMIEDVNPVALAMIGTTDINAILGIPFYGLAQEEEMPLKPFVNQVLVDGMVRRERILFSTIFGAQFAADVVFSPIIETGSCIEGVLLMMQDLTDQVVLQENLLQSEKMSALGKIVAGLAHELNNPLTGILGYLQLLLVSAKFDNVVRTRLDHIMREAERCKKIVESLLVFSRSESTQRTLQDINRILMDTMALRDYQLRSDGVEVTCSLQPGMPFAEVNEDQLRRVFLCLINNAQQALSAVQERPRKLLISSRYADGKIQVIFDDNGPGIPKAIQSKIFDPFFTTKDIGFGMGLGLSVVYGVMVNHNGSIVLESEEGEGCTFILELPAQLTVKAS